MPPDLPAASVVGRFISLVLVGASLVVRCCDLPLPAVDSADVVRRYKTAEATEGAAAAAGDSDDFVACR